MKKPLLRRFICVQGTYYLVKNNRIYTYKRQAIIDEYGKDSLKDIQSFDTFTVEPNHIKYRENINGDWNLYHKLSNKPEQGDWLTIENYLKHIFNNSFMNDDECYNKGLEYFWNLYMNPKQRLPLLGLVSKKKGTGKSTMIYLMQELFESNAILIDNEDLTGTYNGSWAGKLIACIDEKPDGKTALKELQKLKKLITSFTIIRKEKYQANSQINNYCKFVMASNDRDSMLRIEDENTRFWILEIDKINKPDYNIEFKIKQEIPAFLYFLKNEFKPKGPRSRVYFLPEEINTRAGNRMQNESKPALYFEIQSVIERAFGDIEEILSVDENTRYNKDYFYASLKDFSDCLRNKYDIKYIRKILIEHFNFSTTEKQIRYLDILNSSQKRRGKPFIVKR